MLSGRDVEGPGVSETELAESILAAVKFILDNKSELKSPLYGNPINERRLNLFLMVQLQQALEMMVKAHISGLMRRTGVWKVKNDKHILITPYDNVYDIRRRLYKKYEIHIIIDNVAKALRGIRKEFNIDEARDLAELLESFKNNNEKILEKMVDAYWYRYADEGKCVNIGPGRVKVGFDIAEEEVKEALKVAVEFGRMMIDGDLRKLINNIIHKRPKKIKIAIRISCILDKNCGSMPLDELIKLAKEDGYDEEDVHKIVRYSEKYGWIKVDEKDNQKIVTRVWPEGILQEDRGTQAAWKELREDDVLLIGFRGEGGKFAVIVEKRKDPKLAEELWNDDRWSNDRPIGETRTDPSASG